MNSLEQQRKAFKARLIKQPIIKRNIVHRNEPSNAHSVTNFENKLHNKIFEARRMQKKQCKISFSFFFFVKERFKIYNHFIILKMFHLSIL